MSSDKITAKYLVYCNNHAIIKQNSLGIDTVNNLGMLTNKYFYNIYKILKNYNINNINILKQSYDIFSSYKFEHKLIITTDEKQIPSIFKNSYDIIIDKTEYNKYEDIIDNSNNNNNIIILKINKKINYNKLVFIDEPLSPARYYNETNKVYKNILEKKGYNIISKSILTTLNEYSISQTVLKECMNLENCLFILNPINFASFLLTPNITTSFEFIQKKDYIVIWQEIMNIDLTIIGYPQYMNTKFIIDFFTNSKLNIVSNLISLNTLYSKSIYNNIYFSVSGYSPINNIVPLPVNKNKSTDIFIYGSMNENFYYRYKIINGVKQNCKHLNILVGNNYWKDQLDNILQNTKIVIHVPSHNSCKHIPWAKINYLQAKKVFYIVEENEETNILNYNDIIPVYKRDDITDLVTKINYYLENTNVMEDYINKNFEFVTKNNNLDEIVPKIIIYS